MPDGEQSSKHPLWFGIGKVALPFVIGVISTAFVVGSARQRVSDIVAWKAEVAPRIERMDSRGTLSFEHFHQQYEKEQGQQIERIKELEKESKQIETMKLKIEGLERALLDRQGRTPERRPRDSRYETHRNYVDRR